MKRDLEREIMGLLEERGEGKTICPSEVARGVAGREAGGKAARGEWEPLMEPVREAAARLVAKGRIVVTQRGEVVDGGTAKGPVRFRLR